MIVQKSRMHPDPGDESALRVRKHRVGKPEDLQENLLLPGKTLEDLFLQDFLEGEALGDPEGHGDDRHDGEQREERERRGPELAAVLLEGAGGGKKDPQVPDAEGLRWRQAFRANPPDVFLDKLLRLGDHPGALSVAGYGRD